MIRVRILKLYDPFVASKAGDEDAKSQKSVKIEEPKPATDPPAQQPPADPLASDQPPMFGGM